MLVRSKTVLPVIGPSLEDGAVLVEGNRIRAVGRHEELKNQASGHEVLDLGDMVLLPGLINAHCHLDYTGMKGMIRAPRSFSAWIHQINAIRHSMGIADYVNAIETGYGLLLDGGTTTVGNIESMPEIFGRIGEPPLRVIWFVELIDIRVRQANDDLINGWFKALFYPEHWLGEVGISPHAPYSASPELYRLALEFARKDGHLITTHVAESAQEYDMFRNGVGPMYEFFVSLGRIMQDCGEKTPFHYLLSNGLIDDETLVVHMNYLSSADIREAGRRRMSVAYCPKCHTYFSHNHFPLEALKAAGANICLATDSLASNTTLDLFSEMRAAADKHPGLSPQDLLGMVTTAPARALKKEGLIGVLAEGAFADMVAVPCNGQDPHEAVISFQDKVPFVMVNGRQVRG